MAHHTSTTDKENTPPQRPSSRPEASRPSRLTPEEQASAYMLPTVSPAPHARRTYAAVPPCLGGVPSPSPSPGAPMPLLRRALMQPDTPGTPLAGQSSPTAAARARGVDTGAARRLAAGSRRARVPLGDITELVLCRSTAAARSQRPQPSAGAFRSAFAAVRRI
eukprot:TRINITY_DN274_c1_g1_i1.p2 TRINITY_DN274_c1_g1~~TRINITY_DN274_c1_g1_i1.p2  ORF type:complete len:164 (+),score=42.27 TRINITY_DN274_c1_g1_i1:41-532(+)